MLSTRTTSSGLLLIFLAGVMLCLCGMFGYQHTTMLAVPESPGVHLSDSTVGFTEQLPKEHDPAGVISTAILFVVSLGAVVALLLLRTARERLDAVLPATRRFPPPITLPPLRMPARSCLQVFRL